MPRGQLNEKSELRNGNLEQDSGGMLGEVGFLEIIGLRRHDLD